MEKAQITRHEIYPRVPKITVQEMVQPDGVVRVHLFEETFYGQYTVEITGHVSEILDTLREATEATSDYTSVPVNIGIDTDLAVTRFGHNNCAIIELIVTGKYQPHLPINRHSITMRTEHALRLIDTLETIQNNHPTV